MGRTIMKQAGAEFRLVRSKAPATRLTALPIGLWDERLSTAAVERDLIATDMSRARRAAVIDQHAAMFILQGALDRLARLREPT